MIRGVDAETEASDRAAYLAARLDDAATALIQVVRGVDPVRWTAVPAPGVWSVGKESEHVSEAAAYHLWIVRFTIGDEVSSARPSIERLRLTTDLSPAMAATRLRERMDAMIAVVERLTDASLELPTRPPRAGSPNLATTIERLAIGHLDIHRAAIMAKHQAHRGMPSLPRDYSRHPGSGA
jgi:hypothetical protein